MLNNAIRVYIRNSLSSISNSGSSVRSNSVRSRLELSAKISNIFILVKRHIRYTDVNASPLSSSIIFSMQTVCSYSYMLEDMK